MPWWKTRAYRRELTTILEEQFGTGSSESSTDEDPGTRIVDETDETNEVETEREGVVYDRSRKRLRFTSLEAAGFTVQTAYVPAGSN